MPTLGFISLLLFFAVVSDAGAQSYTEQLRSMMGASPLAEEGQNRQALKNLLEPAADPSSLYSIPQMDLKKNPYGGEWPSLRELNPQLDSGGWGGAGGGVGVGCFAQTADAERVGPKEKIVTSLSAEQLESLTSLVTLDYWEAKDPDDVLESDRHYSHLLQRSEILINEISPIFGLRLAQVRPLIQLDRWVIPETEGLEASNDVNPERPLPASCRLLQLAVRYTNHKEGNGRFPHRIPQIRIFFNPDFFSRLDEINKAILIRHEEFYLLGKSIGHLTSDRIRPLVLFFFSKGRLEERWTSATRRSVQDSLVENFGDYFLFFDEEALVPADAQGTAYSWHSRLTSFHSWLRRLRERNSDCINEGEAPERCQDKANDVEELQGLITEEQSFVYLGKFYLDPNAQNPYYQGIEFVMVPFKDEFLRRRAEGTLAMACREFGGLRAPEGEGARQSILRKAQNYCARIGF